MLHLHSAYVSAMGAFVGLTEMLPSHATQLMPCSTLTLIMQKGLRIYTRNNKAAKLLHVHCPL